MSVWKLVGLSFFAHAVSAGIIPLLAFRTPLVINLGNPYLRIFGMLFSIAAWALPLMFIVSGALFFHYFRAGWCAVAISGVIASLSLVSFAVYYIHAK
jgi:hypothetical protein